MKLRLIHKLILLLVAFFLLSALLISSAVYLKEFWSIPHNTLIIIIIQGILLIFVGYSIVQLFIRPLIYIRYFLESYFRGTLPRDEEQKERDDEVGSVYRQIKRLVQESKALFQTLQQPSNAPVIKTPSPFATIQERFLKQTQQLQQQIKTLQWMLGGFELVRDLSAEAKDLKELLNKLMSALIHYLRAHSGALFLLDTSDPKQPLLKLTASYALQKERKATFHLGEGLVGQVAQELEPLHIPDLDKTDFIEQYVSVEGIQPKSLVLVPMVFKDSLYGVLEIAGFEPFSQEQIQHLRRLAAYIASVIGYVEQDDRNKRLIQQLQKLSEELQQKNTLLEEQNKQLLQAQQTLKSLNARLEQQLKQLQRTTAALQSSQQRLQKILTHTHEIVLVTDRYGKIRYMSPSAQRILGYSEQALTRFFTYVHPDDMGVLPTFIENMLKKPKEEAVATFRYRTASGEWIHLEAKGLNLLNDPIIEGLLIYIRDVSDRVRAERAMRARLKFQSLTEHSPDLIMRVDREGTYLYVNPTIERYTGMPPSFFIRKTFYQIGLSPQEIAFWEKIVKEAFETKEKQQGEIEYPSIIGQRYMQVEAIPEPGPDGTIDTVLLVAHDITDLKRAEMQIRQQKEALERITQELRRQKQEIEEINKDLTESIRYAQRIQASILPSEEFFKKAFKDYFIIFQPKELVSGDFYWVTERDSAIYVAAVDCTGHGVPGAFMSLIGYTLLNQIVNEQGIEEPGEILLQLHQRVQHVLGQTQEGSISQDGMDVALVRIEPDKQRIAFAGAYRPLYFWNRVELRVIKGERYGIGGSLFSHVQDHFFTTKTLYYTPGDAIYLFSDGITDQFGGEKNKKFTPKRLRELIIAYHSRSMQEQKQRIWEAFEKWKNTNPQTDDIVLIGIRL